MNNRPVNPLFATTTPIRYKNTPGGGTGFFLNHMSSTYLVTNRHVVDPDDCSPEKAVIWFRSAADLSQKDPFEISLSNGDRENWYGHPESNNIDIAIVPIQKKLTAFDEVDDENQNFGSFAFSTDHFIHENISVSNKVTIFFNPNLIWIRLHLYCCHIFVLLLFPFIYLPARSNH